jgi:pimeloyl-ACP methyl ester carboxylesterase
MKTTLKLTAIFLSLFAMVSCSPDPKPNGDQVDNYYFVKVGNVALPVRVCGNIKSDIAIIFVHGGPGGSAQNERAYTYWNEIEKYYKVIYWDQRGSGITQGNVKPDEMTIEQFSEDLDNIVDFTKQVAKANSIFIHGISWGGGLSTYYLLDTNHQNKLKGAIIEAPAYDVIHGLELSANFVKHNADSMIALGKDVSYWKTCKQFYADHPTITSKEFNQHLTYVNQSNGVAYNTSNIQYQTVSLPKGELALVVNNAQFAPNSITIEGQSIFTAMDLTSQLNKIKLPLMLVWGAKDGLLPRINLAQKYVTNVGSTDVIYDANKYLLSGHIPHAEEWQQFDIDAKAFVEAHK